MQQQQKKKTTTTTMTRKEGEVGWQCGGVGPPVTGCTSVTQPGCEPVAVPGLRGLRWGQLGGPRAGRMTQGSSLAILRVPCHVRLWCRMNAVQTRQGSA